MLLTLLNESDYVSNTYVLNDEEGNAVVIDPGLGDTPAIRDFLIRHELKLQAVLLTHGHFDHICGLPFLLESFPDIPVYMHELETEFLNNPRLNCSYLDRKIGPVNLCIRALGLSDNDKVNLLKKDFYVIHTPFHTQGSVCYYVPEEKMIFTGDTLFRGAIGRSDLPTGSPRSIIQSLAKLKSLPIDTKVYPGHEKSTTIERELKYNTYLRKEYIPNNK
ncbi:MAG: MBL fold metallo-hydrolase [Bacilli bacterium]|jgi:glyoxylase-like metal-dependent hydrolase (beta-lactamase superfamily II)|nr:MBL fold metallo-hydrolase [Bacilli bacterium]